MVCVFFVSVVALLDTPGSHSGGNMIVLIHTSFTTEKLDKDKKNIFAINKDVTTGWHSFTDLPQSSQNKAAEAELVLL